MVVGAALGTRVGLAVGIRVGGRVGVAVGVVVGILVGFVVGVLEGVGLGIVVGLNVGAGPAITMSWWTHSATSIKSSVLSHIENWAFNFIGGSEQTIGVRQIG
jgi:hypothetical protein